MSISPTNEEIEFITELICDVVNNTDENQAIDKNEYEISLFNELDKLDSQYGDVAFLKSTRADFESTPETRLTLYKKAIKLARISKDTSCLIQSIESIIEIYIVDKPNSIEALKWLEELLTFDEKERKEHMLSSCSELTAKLNRKSFKLVK